MLLLWWIMPFFVALYSLYQFFTVLLYFKAPSCQSFSVKSLFDNCIHDYGMFLQASRGPPPLPAKVCSFLLAV